MRFYRRLVGFFTRRKRARRPWFNGTGVCSGVITDDEGRVVGQNRPQGASIPALHLAAVI